MCHLDPSSLQLFFKSVFSPTLGNNHNENLLNQFEKQTKNGPLRKKRPRKAPPKGNKEIPLGGFISASSGTSFS